jgi:hypothetical protein
VFYFGAVDGGVWKTTNGGTELAEHHRWGLEDRIGRRHLPSRRRTRNVIYVGSGEADLREDWTYGDGMYRSPTPAKHGRTSASTTHATSRASSSIRANPDRVFVAALGHASGKNAYARILPIARRREELATGAGTATTPRRDRHRDGPGQLPRIAYAALMAQCNARRGDSLTGTAVCGSRPTAGDTWRDISH